MAVPHSDYSLSQLEVLEAESIHIMREVAAEFERPVLLFSGGKDSIVMLALAERAFWPPGPVPGHARGYRAQLHTEASTPGTAGWPRPGCKLVVASARTPSTLAGVAEETGRAGQPGTGCRPPPWLDAIEENASTRVFGVAAGTRRRPGPKERVFSFRTEFGQWDPRTSVPNCGASTTPGSGWVSTSGSSRCPMDRADVWQYIAREKLEIRPSTSPSAAGVRAGWHLLAENEFTPRVTTSRSSRPTSATARVGDMTCTGAVESTASERSDVDRRGRGHPGHERGQTRADDRASEAAMEDRKRRVYF